MLARFLGEFVGKPSLASPQLQGFPDGLAGSNIPRDGRIIAVADAYDAMTSDRPYRSGMSQEKAESILREGAGMQWDPEMVQRFLDVMPDILLIKAKYQRSQPTVRALQEATRPT